MSCKLLESVRGEEGGADIGKRGREREGGRGIEGDGEGWRGSGGYGGVLKGMERDWRLMGVDSVGEGGRGIGIGKVEGDVHGEKERDKFWCAFL